MPQGKLLMFKTTAPPDMTVHNSNKHRSGAQGLVELLWKKKMFKVGYTDDLNPYALNNGIRPQFYFVGLLIIILFVENANGLRKIEIVFDCVCKGQVMVHYKPMQCYEYALVKHFNKMKGCKEQQFYICLVLRI